MGTIISEGDIAKDIERISSSKIADKLCDKNYSKDNITYNTDTDTNKLKNQLAKLLEKIVNTNEAHHFAELHNLISIIETKLDEDELLLMLKVVGNDKVSYDIHKSTTSMELELHLRTYVLVLEAYSQRQPLIRKQFCQTLYKSLATLYDTHKRHTELLKRGLLNAKSPQGQHKVKPVKPGPYSILEEGIKIQNYNIDFLLLHLHDSLHTMDGGGTQLFGAVEHVKASFVALNRLFSEIDVTIDDRNAVEAYNHVHEALKFKFPANYWFKDWKYLYGTYVAFIEWSSIPINRDLISKGELMIVKSLWKFGYQELSKKIAKSETKEDDLASGLASSSDNLTGYQPISYPCLLLYGILDIAQNLAIRTSQENTLSHCYYLATLFLNFESTEYIRYKATEVLWTIFKKKPITFSKVELDFERYEETLSESDKESFTDIRTYLGVKHIYEYNSINRRGLIRSDTKRRRKVSFKNSEHLLNADPHDLSILTIIAEYLTCPLTQEATGDFRVLPCNHKVSSLLLDQFFNSDRLEIKCLHCNGAIKIEDIKNLPAPVLYKLLHSKFMRTRQSDVLIGNVITEIANNDNNNYNDNNDNNYNNYYNDNNDNNYNNYNNYNGNNDEEESNINVNNTKESFRAKLNSMSSSKSTRKQLTPQQKKELKVHKAAYKQGKQAFDEGRYDDAIPWLEKAAQYFSNSSTIQCDLGISYMKTSNNRKGIQNLKQVIRKNPKSARALAWCGEFYRSNKLYKKSLKALDQALDIKPNNTFALCIRGAVYFELNRYDDALRDLDLAIGIDPNQKFALKTRGYVNAMLNQYNDAVCDLSRLLEIKPTDTFALKMRGKVCFALKQHQNALYDFNEFLKIEENDADILSMRGMVYYMVDQFENALNDFNKSLEINSNDNLTLNKRGHIYCKLRQYDEAFKDFDNSLITKPNNAFALRGRGYLYAMSGQYEPAISDLIESLEVEENDAFAWAVKGGSHFMLKQFDKALYNLNQSLKIDPNDAFALRIRGNVYRVIKQYDNALKDLDQSLAAEPDNAFALRVRGAIYCKLRQYNKALEDLNQSLKMEPNNAFALRVRGNTYSLLKQYRNASKDLNKSLEIVPNNAFALNKRGALYYMLGQYNSALTDLSKSLMIEPNNAFTLRARGNTHIMLEQYGEAIEDLNKSLSLEPNNKFALNARERACNLLKKGSLDQAPIRQKTKKGKGGKHPRRKRRESELQKINRNYI